MRDRDGGEWGDFRCPEPDTCRHRPRPGVIGDVLELASADTVDESMVTERAPRARLKAVPATGTDASTAVLLTIPEAAERLGLSTDQVRRRRKSGALASVRRASTFGFEWMIRLDESMPAEVVEGEAPVVQSRRRAVATPAPVIDLEAIRADHLAEVARLADAHAGEVGALRTIIAEHGGELALLAEVHAHAFTRLEAAHADALKAHAETLAVVRTTHAGEVDAIRRELATASAWANRSWWRWLFGLPPA